MNVRDDENKCLKSSGFCDSAENPLSQRSGDVNVRDMTDGELTDYATDDDFPCLWSTHEIIRRLRERTEALKLLRAEAKAVLSLCREDIRAIGGSTNLAAFENAVARAGRLHIRILLGGAEMGMFNYVDYTAPCPCCNNPVSGFQTKSSKQELTLATVKPKDCVTFYSACEHCDEWVEMYVGKEIRTATAEEIRKYHHYRLDPSRR